jgi:hypothetical protein
LEIGATQAQAVRQRLDAQAALETGDTLFDEAKLPRVVTAQRIAGGS